MTWPPVTSPVSNAFGGFGPESPGTRVAFPRPVRFSAAIAVAILSFPGLSRAATVAQAQAALAQAQSETARMEANRQSVQSALDQLGATIAEKKRALPANAEPGVELIGMLQESTRLAAQLDDLQRQAAEATTRSQQAADELAHSCDSELGALQTRWSQSAAAERPALEGRIAEVSRSCTGRTLGQGDKPAGRVIPASALAPTPGDDAQSLQQKADFLRDREDLLRRRIAQMSQRIDALNRERTLARRVSEFVKEQDLFDENDTRVSVSRTEYGAASAPQVGPTTNVPSLSQTSGRDGAGSGGGGGAGLTGATPGGGMNNNPQTLGSAGGPSASLIDAPSGAEGPQGSRADLHRHASRGAARGRRGRRQRLTRGPPRASAPRSSKRPRSCTTPRARSRRARPSTASSAGPGFDTPGIARVLSPNGMRSLASPRVIGTAQGDSNSVRTE